MVHAFREKSKAAQLQLNPVAGDCSEDHPCDDCVDWVNDDGSYDPCATMCVEHNCQDCQQFSNVDGGFSQQEAVMLWDIGIKLARSRIHEGRG